MNYYGLFFTLGSKVVRLPVNPEELPDSLPGNNETYNILGIGEVTALRTPRQRVVDINGLFPARVESYVLTPNKFMKPEEYIKFFRDAMYNRSILVYTPVRYMEDGAPFATDDLGFNCTVENFEVKESGAETGDFYFSLSIKEYRDFAPQTVKAEIKVTPASTQTVVTTTPARSVPEDEMVVGTPVTVNGPVYQQLTTAAESPVQASGQSATVSRIDESKDNPYYIVDKVLNPIGWVTRTALTIAKNTLGAQTNSGVGGINAGSTKVPMTR